MIPRRDGKREHGQQTKGLAGKTINLHVHHAFLYISSPFLHDDVKLPTFAF